jgi:hypothetical protein
MRGIPFFFVSALALGLLVAARADESRRFFDFTPVSATNPAVATIDGAITIPRSELRAYRDTERLQAITDPASLAQKRALLEDLISEYLYVDDAHRTGVVQSGRFLKQMEATRTMILTDFMSARALSQKSQTSAETSDAAVAMAERLFEATDVRISNEAHDLLKRAARAVEASSAASKRGPLVDSAEEAAAKLHAIINATPEAVLVRYENRSLSVRQILSIYAGLPAPRPTIETQDGFVAMIKPLILPELMALEAVKQGLAAEPEFQNKLIQNRNALLRFHMHGVIESRANDVLKGSNLETHLQAWYREHADRYAAPAADGGKTKPPPFAEVRPRVVADFSVDLRERLLAEKARELRKLRAVVIDEAVLRSL